MKKTILLITFFSFISASFSQNKWRDAMFDRSENFHEIQSDFKIYYDSVMQGSNKIPKGKGIKQFKRWEYYWSSRVDENGNFPNPEETLREIENYNSLQSSSRNYDSGTGTWEIVGPIPTPTNGTGQLNGNGRINCIAFHPTDPNTIYAGAPAGGFWKSTDNGGTWTEFSSGLTRLGVSSIVIHPSTPNTIYIATGDRDGGDVAGYGVWRSTDGGATWAAHNNGMGNRTINEIIMDPNDSNIMLAAASNGRIYRTTDGGANWSQSSSLGTNPKDISFHPTISTIVYASGTEFHRSTDGGATWSQVTSGVPTTAQRIALAVSVNEPNWVYLLAGGGSGLVGIYRSTNNGITFNTRTTTPNIMGYETDGSGTGSQAWYDIVIAADPSDANIIYTGGVNLWKSTDGGTTMNCISYWVSPQTGPFIDAVHADQHALEFSPHTNNLYNGNDGGVYYTTDSGTNWNDISDGLAIAQVYKIGVSQTVKDLAINGYQDNGTAISRGASFQTEIGGDGMECIIDPTDENYMYGALYYGDIRRSTNNGNSFSRIASDGTNGINETGGWVTPYKLDPNNPARMFAGYDNVWRSDDVKSPAAASVSWTRISNFGGTSNIRDIAVAPSNSDVVYVSRYDNSFHRSNNATDVAPTWTNLTGGLPVSNEPLDIEIDPTDPTHLFIALNGNIYESTDSGASWTDISGTLPNISLNTIVIDHTSPVDAMYVGMDVGVYYKDNTLADWTPYLTNLPNIEITELEIQYGTQVCDNKLFAATYAQGLWKSDLKDPGNIAPVSCFEASTTDGCLGNVFVLTDHSSYTPTSWSWNITPGTFTYTNGTDSTSQNPEVLFTAPGSYTIELTTTNGTGNDTHSKPSYINVSSASLATSFNDDLESETLCATTNDCGTTLCNLSGLWNNLTNGSDDNVDWRIDEGGTPSGTTGPSIDYNPGTATGNYAYLEASNGCFGQTATLESDCVNLDQDYLFEFAYHMYGADTGSLHVDILSSGNWITDIMPSVSGDQGDVWNTASIDLTAYTGQTVKLRIRGITGTDYRSDIAIDDLKFALNPLSIEDNVLAASGVGIFPNPAENIINIINPNLLDLNEIIIYDLTGRIVNSINLTDMGAQKTVNIDNLQSAIYIINIKGKDGELIKRLVKR